MLDGPFSLSGALQVAFGAKSGVVLFSAWRPAGSLAASVGALLVRVPKRLRTLPLNLTIGSAPYTTTDDVALSFARFRVADVAIARRAARVARYRHAKAFDGDFVNSDWDYAVNRLATENGELPLGINSFIAIDTISSTGEFRFGSRPVVGRRVKKGELRLPRLIGLRAKDASEQAVRRLCEADLLLVNLHHARGPRAAQLVASVLQVRPSNHPVVLLSENASELVRLLLLDRLDNPFTGLACGEEPDQPSYEIRVVGQARVQSEQQFDYSLPSGELTDDERDLVNIARAAWRSQWRSLNAAPADWSPRSRFVKHLVRLQQYAPSAADRFRLVSKTLDRLADDAQIIAEERVRAVMEVLRETKGRILAIVGNKADQDYLTRYLESRGGATVETTVARHAADALQLAEQCVVCGYYGPVTIDAVLRSRPRKVFWILDPVEAASAALECHRQAGALGRLGMPDFADLLRVMNQVLFGVAGGVRSEAADDHPEIFASIMGTVRDMAAELEVEVVDDNPTMLLVLSDGAAVRTSGTRKFDVVRAGAPVPTSVTASELEEGDQILLVRGSYQRTVSELLIEDMDKQELRTQATLRETWAELVRITVESRGLRIAEIVQRVRQGGASATNQQVRAWLRGEGEYTTPRDWRAFLAFARAINIALPEEELRQFYDAIRLWRVGHRKRGRDVVRLMRLAWFGGLSAVDLARIEEKWGLGVRDLLEGVRVVEVESVVKDETEVRDAAP